MNKRPEANKKLGQHFLVNENVIQTICNDFANESESIIEVGPGPGILTEHLAKHNKSFYVVEKDKRFEDHLKSIVGEKEVFIQDALNFSWAKLFRVFKLQEKNIWLVSNLPYNVGTILFTNFLSIPQIKYMTLMFQKEVGQKTYLRHEKNEMNGLLFLSLNYFESKKLVKVSPGSFSPPPKVDSIVVSYTRRENPDVSIEQFEKLNSFLRVLFGQKRKQIQKVLKSQYSEENILQALEKSKIPASLRAESLKYQDVLNLYLNLNNN